MNHDKGSYLYSISRDVFSVDTSYGTITAYRIDPEPGNLAILNEQSVEAWGSALVSINPRGRFTNVSNYNHVILTESEGHVC